MKIESILLNITSTQFRKLLNDKAIRVKPDQIGKEGYEVKLTSRKHKMLMRRAKGMKGMTLKLDEQEKMETMAGAGKIKPPRVGKDSTPTIKDLAPKPLDDVVFPMETLKMGGGHCGCDDMMYEEEEMCGAGAKKMKKETKKPKKPKKVEAPLQGVPPSKKETTAKKIHDMEFPAQPKHNITTESTDALLMSPDSAAMNPHLPLPDNSLPIVMKGGMKKGMPYDPQYPMLDNSMYRVFGNM